MSSVVDSITGGRQAESAARHAAAAQTKAGQDSIAFQKEMSGEAREDLAPFRELGERNISGLESLITNPLAQQSFIQDNPFFQSLSESAARTLLNNQATKAKLGSGETAAALQQKLFGLGADLLNQNIGQRQNLVTLGSNAAGGQATISQQLGQSVGATLEGIGNAQAAGMVGGANAKQQGRAQLMGAGGQLGGAAIMACDMRLKENIQEVGKLNNGLPIYLFNYKGDDKIVMNVMAQDVEKVIPDAVEEIDGYKYVNMEKIW